MAHISTHNYIKMGMALLGSKLGMLWKLSYVVGSSGIMFSMSNFCTPLIGLYGGTFATSVLWTIIGAIRFCIASVSLSMAAFYIPGYCAALYLALENKFLKSGMALLCMVLFLVHPIGYQAAPYAMYWIIPIIVEIYAYKSLFMQALGATFTAHAVGSVIWIYTVPMDVMAWYDLIPVVAIERITYAAGIVVIYHGINLVYKSAEYYIKKYLPCPFSYIR